MEFTRINLSVAKSTDGRLDELDAALRKRKGTPRGGGWRSKIVAMLVERASVDDLVAMVEADERKAA